MSTDTINAEVELSKVLENINYTTDRIVGQKIYYNSKEVSYDLKNINYDFLTDSKTLDGVIVFNDGSWLHRAFIKECGEFWVYTRALNLSEIDNFVLNKTKHCIERQFKNDALFGVDIKLARKNKQIEHREDIRPSFSLQEMIEFFFEYDEKDKEYFSNGSKYISFRKLYRLSNRDKIYKVDLLYDEATEEELLVFEPTLSEEDKKATDWVLYDVDDESLILNYERMEEKRYKELNPEL